MKDVVKAVVEFTKPESGGNTVTATVSLDDQGLEHLLKTDKLNACRRIVETPGASGCARRIVEENSSPLASGGRRRVFRRGFRKPMTLPRSNPWRCRHPPSVPSWWVFFLLPTIYIHCFSYKSHTYFFIENNLMSL